MKVTTKDVSNLDTVQDLGRYVAQVLGDVTSTLNGGIGTDNLKCKVSTVKFTATGVDVAVAHGLGSIPKGYLKILGPNIQIFDGKTPNTADNVYVQSSGVGTVTLLILG